MSMSRQNGILPGTSLKSARTKKARSRGHRSVCRWGVSEPGMELVEPSKVASLPIAVIKESRCLMGPPIRSSLFKRKRLAAPSLADDGAVAYVTQNGDIKGDHRGAWISSGGISGQPSGLADVIIVAGGNKWRRFSSLCEINAAARPASHLAADKDKLDLGLLRGANTTGLTAGASAPELIAGASKRSGVGPVNVVILPGVRQTSRSVRLFDFPASTAKTTEHSDRSRH